MDPTVFHCFSWAIHFVWLGGNYQMDKWFGKTQKSTKAIWWRFVVPKACRIYCSITSETLVLLLFWTVLFITACPSEQKGQHLIGSYNTCTRIYLGSLCGETCWHCAQQLNWELEYIPSHPEEVKLNELKMLQSFEFMPSVILMYNVRWLDIIVFF